jgi:glycosyltransferase involved in cell wall biosynthesis
LRGRGAGGDAGGLLFAAAIQQVAADPAMRARLAAQSALAVRRHGWESKLRDFESVYEKVASAV